MTSPELDKVEPDAGLWRFWNEKARTLTADLAFVEGERDEERKRADENAVHAARLSSELADAKAEAKQWYECFEQNAANAAHAIARSLDLETELAASRDRERALERERDFEQSSRLTSEAQLGTQIDNLLRQREAAEAEVKRLREALEPFAKVGRIIDGPFGPALFADDDEAFKSGCAWTENGERKKLTWGDFRRALSEQGEAK